MERHAELYALAVVHCHVYVVTCSGPQSAGVRQSDAESTHVHVAWQCAANTATLYVVVYEYHQLEEEQTTDSQTKTRRSGGAGNSSVRGSKGPS